jgi:xanthine dehydrogenase large subunit
MIAGKPVPHESARGHVSGAALYTDDLTGRFPNLPHAWPVCAPHAHAIVTSLDVTAALEESGVATVLVGADAPGKANTGPNQRDEPLFPTEVMFYGQPVAWVLADTLTGARVLRGTARAV